MGNDQNDKRLKKCETIKGEIGGTSNAPPQMNNNQPQMQMNQPPKTNEVQKERINPYNTSSGISTGGGFGQNPMLNRSFTRQTKNTVTLKMLKDAFRTYSIDGSYLNRPRFNDAIESIFRFNIPEMHYTYLSEKIFNLLDDSGDGKIQEDEFLNGFTMVLKERNYRILLSMMAMMTLPDQSRDYIEIKEIQDFFFHSFVEGYKHIGWQLKRNPAEFKLDGRPVATIKQLGEWAQKYEKQIKDEIEKDLKMFDTSICNTVTLEQFKRWIYNDHVIYIQYGSKNIMIATSLIKLDEIHFDESMANTSYRL